MRRFTLLLLFPLPFIIAGATGCDESNDSNPGNSEDHPPVITSVTASPSTMAVGDTTVLTCIATDEDGDDLSFTWSATAGAFPQDDSGFRVIWAAFAGVGEYTITVTVSDGHSSDEGTTTLLVEGGRGSGIERDFDLGSTGMHVSMIWVEPGTFMMGAQTDEADAGSDEFPNHLVTISQGFWMGKYEVTQAQWEAVMGSNPSFFIGSELPVEQVSYNDITTDFLPEINGGLLDGPWRLPTEAEWEYAARAGTNTRFYWGNDVDEAMAQNYAWYDDNSMNTTHPVGQKLPNAWGFYDVSGNVWEWCNDWFSNSYYSISPIEDPSGPSTGSSRVKRGGSWIHWAEYCRSAERFPEPPHVTEKHLGFRLVRMDE